MDRKLTVIKEPPGGVIAAMLALYDELPIRHTGSAGGLYGPDLFNLLPETVPFDLGDNNEKQMRVLIGNIRWMKRPHYAFTGDGDVHMQRETAKQEASNSQAPLKIIGLAGDHHSSLAPAMRGYLKIALEEK